jgi:hypothetical protein
MELPKPLPLPMFTSSGLMESSRLIPCDAIQCQVTFDLGRFYFLQGDINKAGTLFNKCQQLLPLVNDHPFVHVSRSDLAGYLCACMTSLDTESPLENDLMHKAQQSKQNNYKGILDVLMEDVVKQQLTVQYRQSVEDDLAKIVQSPDQQAVYRQVCLCNAVCILVNCHLVPPAFWSLFDDNIPSQIKEDVEFVCKVCSLLAGESVMNIAIRDSLAFLLQEMCLRLRRGNAVSIVQCSQVAKLINEENWKMIHKVCKEGSPAADSKSDALPSVEIRHTDHAVYVWHLIDQLGQALQPSRICSVLSDLTAAVNDLDEENELLYKYFGNYPYNDAIRKIPDRNIRQLCCVLQSKAHHCFQLEIYDAAVSLLQAAVETANRCKSKPVEVINILEQQFLVAQLLHTRSSDYRRM